MHSNRIACWNRYRSTLSCFERDQYKSEIAFLQQVYALKTYYSNKAQKKIIFQFS